MVPFSFILPRARLFYCSHWLRWIAKFSLSFSNVQSTIFLFVGETEPARRGASPTIFNSAIFFRFPDLSWILFALSPFVRSRRPRVRSANFAIKQSDARTASVMTVRKRREGEGGSNRFAVRTDLKQKRREEDRNRSLRLNIACSTLVSRDAHFFFSHDDVISTADRATNSVSTLPICFLAENCVYV